MIQVKDEIWHYASPYYDPVKAHEYYEAHKHLKGRRSTTKLSDEGKEVWAYTKNQITEEKKGKQTEERQNRDQKLEETRAKATAARERISSKLKGLNKALVDKTKSARENISSQKQEKIEALQAQKIPKDLPARKRARLVAQKQAKIAKLRGEAQTESEKLTELSKNERKSMSSSASEERQKVSTQLKAVLTATREAYKASKENLDSSYEEIYQQEFDKILAEYPWVSKKKGKSSSGSSSGRSSTKRSGSSSSARRRSGSYTRSEMSKYLQGG